MRKTAMVSVIIALVLIFCGCGLFVTEIETGAPDPASEYTYYTSPVQSTAAPEVSSSFALQTEESASVYTTEPTTVVLTPVQPFVPESTAIRPTETTVLVPEATAAQNDKSTTLPDGDVDLSIQLPSANGTMEVSVDPSNGFIKAVHEARGIDTSLLAAVYAVPESGQNYVFEFSSAGERTADSLRRVYLLDSSGTVTSVAAAVSAERENISVTENWFCMNVLIKGMVFPAVQDRLS